jgi:Protein kinase domain
MFSPIDEVLPNWKNAGSSHVRLTENDRLEYLTSDDPEFLGRYRLRCRVGTGGMGVVYLADSPRGLQVALKLIRLELSEDPAFRARFRQEVIASQKVSGICTAKYLDAELDGLQPYVVTEYIEGGNLADYVSDHGPLRNDQLIGLAVGLAEAVVAMHAAGVIHRDLKPSNVLMAPDGPKVVDFGIAQSVDGSTLTDVGLIVGSPSCMAPEQAKGGWTTPATDVFAWGATVAFAATGRSPFGDGRPEVILYRVVHEEPDLNGVDAKLRPIVAAALAKDPAQRPSADKLLVGVLQNTVPGSPPPGGSTAVANLMLDRTWRHVPAGVPHEGRRHNLRRKRAVWIGAAVLILMSVLVAVFVFSDPLNSPRGVSIDALVTVTGGGPQVGSAIRNTGASDLLVAMVSTEFEHSIIVSGGGLSWTQVARYIGTATTAGEDIEVWTARAHGGHAHVIVSSSMTGPSPWLQSLTVMAFGDAVGVGAIAKACYSVVGCTSRSLMPRLSVVPTKTGSRIIGVGYDYSDQSARSVTRDQTLDQQAFDATERATMWVQTFNLLTVARLPVSIGDTTTAADDWALVGFEVTPRQGSA